MNWIDVVILRKQLKFVINRLVKRSHFLVYLFVLFYKSPTRDRQSIYNKEFTTGKLAHNFQWRGNSTLHLWIKVFACIANDLQFFKWVKNWNQNCYHCLKIPLGTRFQEALFCDNNVSRHRFSCPSANARMNILNQVHVKKWFTLSTLNFDGTETE